VYYACVCVSVHVCACVRVCMNGVSTIEDSMYVCMVACLCMCACTYIYIYIYIYICAYSHTNIL